MHLKLNLLAGAIVAGLSAGAAAQGMSQGQAAAQQAGAGASTQQADSQGQSGQTKLATKAEVKAGAAVYDAKGNSVGKIESVDSQGAVVSTGNTRAKIPLSSIAHNDKGLVISLSRAEIDAAAKKKGSD
jgi:hypothetical protein